MSCGQWKFRSFYQNNVSDLGDYRCGDLNPLEADLMAGMMSQ